MANIINKGIQCVIRAHGNGLKIGSTYTATLYINAKYEEFRASSNSVAVDYGDGESGLCIFTFSPEQTASLKAGNEVKLEIFDTDTLENMYFDDKYALIRATSLKS